MKIAFFAAGPRSGLANNGGSRTIVKSAEVLRSLGHKVWIVAKHNSYTWGQARTIKGIPPEADVVVAVSARDIPKALEKCGSRPLYWWVRGRETWAMPELEILRRASMAKCICNAQHLCDWLFDHGLYSELCYAGLDFPNQDDVDMLRSVMASEKTVVGFIYNKKHESKWKDIEEVQRALPNVNYVAYGTHKDGPPQAVLYKSNPSDDEKSGLYSTCDIWFTGATNEGFHNPPAEAALHGCLVVARAHHHNGVGDYCTRETAYLYRSVGEAVQAIGRPDFGKCEKMRDLLSYQLGSRERNMRLFAEMLCQ